MTVCSFFSHAYRISTGACLLVVLVAGASAHRACAATTDMVLSHAGVMPGDGLADGWDIVVDSAGSTYSTGEYEGTVDFDPGPGVFNLTSVGDSDVYILKLDTFGDFVWAVSIGGPGEDSAESVDVDSTGNVYVSGTYFDTIDLDPGAGVASATHAGVDDFFICKLDSAGAFQWGAGFGSTGADRSEGMRVDGAGNVYCTGAFQGTVDFDPGAGAANLTAAAGVDVYVLKLDTNGIYQWAQVYPGNNVAIATDLSLDSAGNIGLSGVFVDTVDFDPGAGVFNLTSAGAADGFICKLDPSGGLVWAGAFSGLDDVRAIDILVDDLDNFYVTGWFRATADFDPSGAVANRTSMGVRDAFIAKLNSAGAFQWAAAFGGVDTDLGINVALDGANNVFTTGQFADTVDFDPGAGVFNITSAGDNDAYVSKLDSNGNFVWAGAIGGVLSDTANGLVADGAGSVYVTGRIESSADFDPGAGTYTLNGQANYDLFVARLEPQALPVAAPDAGQTDADQLLTALTTPASNNLLDNDTDANALANMSVAAFDATSSLGATVIVNADGTFIYDPTGVGALQALGVGVSMDDTFTYTVSDGLDTSAATVTITVFGPGTGAGAGLPALNGWGLALVAILLALAGARYRNTRTRKILAPQRR